MQFLRYLSITAIAFNCLLSYSTAAKEHQNIQQQLLLNLDAIHYNKFSHAQFAVLASAVDKQLNFIFENCQLAPQADAQLHLLLAKIMQGNDLMKSDKNKKSGAVIVLQALQEYPRYFNDSNWQNIVH